MNTVEAEKPVQAAWKVGIDVGGTFTDIIAVHPGTGEVRDGKVLSTPRQEDGVMAAIESIGLSPTELTQLVHGHTVGINAVLSRTGSRTGLLTTTGHRDLLDIGRMNREFGEHFYDPTWLRPHQVRPIVSRAHRVGVVERLAADGSVIAPLDEEAVRAAARRLAEDGVESIGVCFINAYANPQHEERAVEIIRKEIDDVYVQSSKLYPVTKEHERSTTVALDAYVGPVVTGYLDRLKARLSDAGFPGSLWIMMMNGGVATVDDAARTPVFQLVSGPVGGVAGTVAFARSSGLENLITVDVGGTSTDVASIAGTSTPLTDLWTIEHGLTLTMPLVDVGSVGSGAGSIIAYDRLGSLRVGPASAGSNPGPACYGRGGTLPTLTDACAQLGILQPDLFAGGSLELNLGLAEQSLDTIAGAAGSSVDELALSAYEIACEDIANKVRSISVYRGLDVREFTLMPFGAAGPMLANRVAQVLRLNRVVVPPNPGQFSAHGLLSSDLRVTRAESPMSMLSADFADDLETAYQRIQARIAADLSAQGVAVDDITFERAWYGMYAGQTWDNRIELTASQVTGEEVTAMCEQFHDFYQKSYGFAADELPVFLTSIEVTGVIPREATGVRGQVASEKGGSLLRTAQARLPGLGLAGIEVHDRAKLSDEQSIAGPALVVEKFATTVVLPDFSARNDDGHLVITRNGKEAR